MSAASKERCVRAEDRSVTARPIPVLSVIMPVYNEAQTFDLIVDKIIRLDLDLELIVIDDGSTDGTADHIKLLAGMERVCCVSHSRNMGKGAAIKTGLAHARGNVVVIQDADLEYEPADYFSLIGPIINGTADVVFGSRFSSTQPMHMSPITRAANACITWLFNRAMGTHLTDVETCYKAFRREIVAELIPALAEARFGVEIELAAKLARIPGIRITETPIRYRARTRHDGKKIRWTDGFRALWCIVKYR